MDDTETEPREATKATDEDEELDEAAQGQNLNADDVGDVDSEVDAAGAAAGLVSRDEKPFRGVEEVDRRDVRRWELDPKSREDGLDN